MSLAQPGFDLLYEAGPCLVVAKPSGLLTQAPPEIDSLELRVKEFLREREAKPGRIYLGVPHRLDRPVSGALVLARHQRAARRISDQFAGRLVDKTYWAFVQGIVSPAKGTWQDHVRKLPDLPLGEVVPDDHPEAKLAVLHYRVLAATTVGCWLEIRLDTGRMHQIRIQAASRGHAIVGDRQYGSAIPFGEHGDDERRRSIALHARRLSFQHPMTREQVTVEAPLPDAWDALALPAIS